MLYQVMGMEVNRVLVREDSCGSGSKLGCISCLL